MTFLLDPLIISTVFFKTSFKWKAERADDEVDKHSVSSHQQNLDLFNLKAAEKVGFACDLLLRQCVECMRDLYQGQHGVKSLRVQVVKFLFDSRAWTVNYDIYFFISHTGAHVSTADL